MKHLLMTVKILPLLTLLHLLSGPATATLPTHDHWGDYGPYGPCSRTCGTGVSMRTRTCVTSRTDGGHNCLGSSKSFRTCNTHECPAGSKDFREEQCSQFDASDFRGKRYTWLPYYGGSSHCELNCVPRGENFFYRHRPKVVDGTPCHQGRTDICVDGTCRALIHGEFLGLDQDSGSVQTSVPVAPPPLGDAPVYYYKSGVFGECSASCGGGMQHRTVECWIQDPERPRVVDESHCVAQRALQPHSQQACNFHPCRGGYTVTSFSVVGGSLMLVVGMITLTLMSSPLLRQCSVTCGEGQQTRKVACAGPGGQRLPDSACQGLPKPASVQACVRPSCSSEVTWHVTDFGLCSQSCGGGLRERQVGCFDLDLNPSPESRCVNSSKPAAQEACNTQPCPGAQGESHLKSSPVKPRTKRSVSAVVPSVQDPAGHENSVRVFAPHPTPAASNTTAEPCSQSPHGCCPDGSTPAAGPRNEGCVPDDCVRTRFGCCLDGVSAAQGFGRAGCPDYQSPAVVGTQSPTPTTTPSTRNVCSLPRDEGPCDSWRSRFYFNSVSGKCTRFWFGGCEGNTNNFVSLLECRKACGGLGRSGQERRASSAGQRQRK
ncbi:papilin b, proteoglycan-like sulfated glycoprotein isoform X2 [Synchiropus splendidus]|uniref:papilin b, proteoglycan-like sulfated glycoprotein isoform X2 n=1 Tax=Synchiropus splendidus TaxID=270530 RepID=UPI00237ECC98|nr:papilin b, proteoglycan-like sulfated glycoprotein isoform X2 [Synchiropus splendidus]